MKGVQIIRALPGNCIDVYALLGHPFPTEDQARNYYYTLLMELQNPHEIMLLAKKGRAFYGYIHGTFTLRTFGEPRVMFIRSLYVTKNKRKLGIGRKLTEEMKSICQKLGVSTIEFMCQDELVSGFEKTLKAGRLKTLMEMKL